MLDSTLHTRHHHARRAVGASVSMVMALVAMEYVVLVWIRPDSFQNPLGSQITDFAISDNGEIGAFILADTGDMANREIRRYRVGFVDLRHGKPHGGLLTLSSTPKRVLKCDGQSGLFIGCWDGSIAYVDSRFETSEPVRFAPQADCLVTNLLYARESKAVIVCGESITARQADTGELLWQRHFAEHRAMAIDDFGKSLYCGLASGEVLQIDPASGHLQRVCAEHDHEVLQLTVSPSGDYLASVLKTGVVVMTRLIDSKVVWKGRASTTCEPAFSVDGTRLVIADYTTQRRLLVIDARSGVQLFALGEHKGVFGVRRGANGNVYSWGSDGCIVAWDLDHRQQRWLSHPANQQGRQLAMLAAIGVRTP